MSKSFEGNNDHEKLIYFKTELVSSCIFDFLAKEVEDLLIIELFDTVFHGYAEDFLDELKKIKVNLSEKEKEVFSKLVEKDCQFAMRIFLMIQQIPNYSPNSFDAFWIYIDKGFILRDEIAMLNMCQDRMKNNLLEKILKRIDKKRDN